MSSLRTKYADDGEGFQEYLDRFDDSDLARFDKFFGEFHKQWPLVVFYVIAARAQLFAEDIRKSAASSQWVRVESEADLPKENGQYLWRTNSGCAATDYLTDTNHPFLIGFYCAWMPIPEFHRRTNNAQ